MTEREAGGPSRAQAMAQRVARTAEHLGISRDQAQRLGSVFLHAVRERGIREETHPDHLHPARTALICMADAALARATALRAALLFDSLFPDLVPDDSTAGRIAGEDAAQLLQALRAATLDSDRLLERLVVADRTVQLVAIAERLDHARHLHLRDDVDRPAFRASAQDVYLPLAQRVNPVLAQRFARWLRAGKGGGRVGGGG